MIIDTAGNHGQSPDSMTAARPTGFRLTIVDCRLTDKRVPGDQVAGGSVQGGEPIVRASVYLQ